MAAALQSALVARRCRPDRRLVDRCGRALTYHVDSVELPYGYETWQAADLTSFGAQLKAQ